MPLRNRGRGASHIDPGLLAYMRRVRRGFGQWEDPTLSVTPLPPDNPDIVLPSGGGGGGPEIIDTTGEGGSGTDWTAFLQNLMTGGLKIAQTATLPSGAYVTRYRDPRTGQIVETMANQVPGAVPGSANFGFSSGIGGGTILLLGGLLVGGLVLASAFKGKG